MNRQDIQDKLVQAMPRVLTLCKIPHDARKLPLSFTADPMTGNVMFTFWDGIAEVAIALKKESDALSERYVGQIFLKLPTLDTNVRVVLVELVHINSDAAPYHVDMGIELGLDYIARSLRYKAPPLAGEIKRRLEAMNFAVLDLPRGGYLKDTLGEPHRYEWNWYRCCFESEAEHVNDAIARATKDASYELPH